MEKPGIMKPALVVGAISGVVLSLPYVRLVNCACCAGVIATGLIAGWSYSKACKAAGGSFAAADGAKVGLLAGLVSSVVSVIVAFILDNLIGQPDMAMLLERGLEWMEQNPDMPEEQLIEMEDRVEAARTGNIAMGERIQGIVIGVVVGPLFGLLGGLMAGSLFKDKEAAPAAPSTPAE